MTSPSFADRIDDYIAVRRRMGYDLTNARWQLLRFARYADSIGHEGPITVDLAVRWARATDSRDPCAAARRLAFVRPFARHRAAFDPATEVPPTGLLGRGAARKSPHIYSDDEVAALLREAALLGPPGGLLSRTLVALFSLLASTGLRVSEACRLTHRDVDLEQGVLVVREGKFRKSRLVPVHPTTAAALARYAVERDRIKPRSEFFFRTDRAKRITRNTVERTLIDLRPRLGWTSAGRARLPRVHDLRHTFAVRRLLRWYEEGADVDRKMLALSTYLGHTAVSYTYWYLSAVPELLAITSSRFEHFAHCEEECAS